MPVNLKFLIISLMVWSLNVFAGSRFSVAEKEAFVDGLKKEIAELKKETNRPFEITKFQGELYGRIAELRNNKNITLLEEKRIIQRFDELVRARMKGNISQEHEVFKIINEEITALDSTELQCIKEGQLCNNFTCCEGLTCAADPVKNKGAGVTTGKACSKNEECASGICEENVKTKEKSCVEVRRCYRPLAVGEKCNTNPVCASGECLPFDSKTSGYAMAGNLGEKCGSNKDCNSNFCGNGICQEMLVCKECVKSGGKLERGLICCEGLMKNSKGQCVPDAPPMILPQVKLQLKKSFIVTLLSFVVNSTHAISNNESPSADSLVLNSIQGNQDKAQGDADAAFASELNRESRDKVFGTKTEKENKTGSYSKYEKSDFKTCNIDFKADYYNYMMENKPKGATGTMFDAEISFLAFDYMALGEENYDDYWKDSKGASIHKRLKEVAKEHQSLRKDIEKKLMTYNQRLTCQCLDISGAEFMGFKADIEKIAKFKQEKKAGKSPSLPSLSQSTLMVICGDKISDKDFCGNFTATTPEPFKEYQDSQLKSYKTKTEYFAKYCPEEKAGLMEIIKVLDDGEGMSSIDLDRGDASAVTGSAMLVKWTNTLKEFNMELTVDNTKIYEKISAVNKWYTEQTTNDKWGAATIKSYDLFRFKINDNVKHKVYTIGAAVLAATLAIGAIAVAGGFSAASILSSWAVAGIIAASAVAGAGGGWMVASLRGAWVSKTPFINDRKENQYDCGTKKDPRTCTEYTRVLKQPYSEICSSHVSSNACIKHFLVTKNDNGVDSYIIDPFIPYGIKKSEIIRDNVELVKRLEDGFNLGLRKLREKDPGYGLRQTVEVECGINIGGVGNDNTALSGEISNLKNSLAEKESRLSSAVSAEEKADLQASINSDKARLAELEAQNTVQNNDYAKIDNCASTKSVQLFSGSEDYRMQPFLDTVAAGFFAPKLNSSYEATYLVNSNIEKLIKEKAKEFAIKEKFFDVKETERLQAFADYAYEFHFKWAKTSQDNIVAYPVPSFMTYLDIMSVGVVGALATGSANAANTFKDLNSKYADHYKNVLSLYKNEAISGKRPMTQVWVDKELKKIENMQQQNRLIDGALGATGTIGAGNSSAISIGNGNSSAFGSLTGLGANFVSSVSSLRNARNEQVKKMDEFNKGVGSGSDRGKGLLNAQAATVKKLASGNNLSNVGRNVFGGSGSSAIGSNTNKNDSSKDKDGKSGSGKNGLNLSDFSQFGAGSSGFGSGGIGGAGLLGGNLKGANKSDKDSVGDGSSAEGNGSNGVSAEDAKRIENAIDARNRGGSGQYSANGEDTLWEIITKTYIRNYDKVLKKRRSEKDTTEKN